MKKKCHISRVPSHDPTRPSLGARRTSSVSQSLSEDIREPKALKRALLDMLTGDDYWHHRIKRVLLESGFGVTRIEREEVHPIWSAWLTRGSFDLADDNKRAGRQIRQVLAKSGIPIRAGELTVLEQRAGRIHCVFIFSCGAAGVIT
ncbi:MAG: hypothetical protein JWR19_830 [Pedosphaera sp.]|nr:hypothetical protein [Pedosphaera sp.]